MFFSGVKGHCVLWEAFSYLVNLTLDAQEGLLFLLVLSSVNKEVLYDIVIFTTLYSSDIDSDRRELQECLTFCCKWFCSGKHKW